MTTHRLSLRGLRRQPLTRLASATLLVCASSSHALSFSNELVSGNFDSNISVGFGMRTLSPSPALILSGNTGGPAGIAAPVASGLGDQGTLNYGKGDPFTTYLKGSHELLMQLPGDVRFLGRVNWIRDYSATRTTGWLSSGSLNPEVQRDGLSDAARDDLRFKARVLDLWVSKSFAIGDQQARLRVGNQVINWGESVITPGGINATNPVDAMRLSQPGTQLKEGILPTPTISLAGGLADGLNAEVYLQTRWRSTYLPPTGSYWSVVNGLGKGAAAYGLSEGKARNSGQWGAALRWKPKDTSLDLGAYVVHYHDKSPQLRIDQTTFAASLEYPEDRRLIGLSANLPVGDWAVGTELSYRSKDAVFLNTNTSACASQGGNCWVDARKLQWHLTGLLQLSPANAGGLMRALGASNGTILTELVVIHYPGLKKAYGPDVIAAGGWGWGNAQGPVYDPVAAAINTVAVGTKTSSGLNADLSLTYDGSLLPGWQVTPGIFISRALSGRTPNIQGTWMKGATTANLYLNFTKNPSTWQFGLNYSMFRGGSSVFDQVLRDRDFVGGYATFNF
ncbi:DUF1302 domain-containing protein [Pseudaquabacterium pictum]|uniref:Arylsulfatase n=1 Tax=Pseudaquabacterium pictum TaxID=2315236 RepID=A0A480AJ53_9BURK|nr:DUF1302 family protein [Rubrivivax pictus]GCL61664.1 hypothetical protein AQPW35_07450 [Rubrivivax pictus]